MHKEYKENTDGLTDFEEYYRDTVLPEFGITQPVTWERHIKTDPDNFLHIFTVGDVRYALAFDDYPSGFSVGEDKSVKSMNLTDGEKVLHISAAHNKYSENITGAFMLFQVVDAKGFDALVKYLEAAYETLQRRWHSEAENVVVIARDLLQLAETAAQNHDSSALYSLQNITETFAGLDVDDTTVGIERLEEYIKILIDAELGYEFYTKDDRKRVQDEIYRLLSREAQNTITIQKYEAGELGQTVRIVNAMYAKTEGAMTSGITVTLLFEGEMMRYPVDHFANDELKNYFAKHTYITKANIEQHMPETLLDYRLVEGSVYVKDVFARELEYISY